jgi:hypothetical protein
MDKVNSSKEQQALVSLKKLIAGKIGTGQCFDIVLCILLNSLHTESEDEIIVKNRKDLYLTEDEILLMHLRCRKFVAKSAYDKVIKLFLSHCLSPV